MRRKLTLLMSVFSLLPGCGAMPGWPGYISTSKSDFDGSTVIAVHPGHASGCCALGAAWNSRAPNEIQITAVAHGGYARLESAAGLEFSVDGRVIRLDATREPTQHDATPGTGAVVHRSSSKTYVMKRSDFDALIVAKTLKVRLNTDRGPMEGDLLRDAYGGSAIEGLRSFAAQLPR